MEVIKTNLNFTKQIVNKILPIVKILYLDYLLLFLFDNVTSYFVFTQDIVYTKQINKRTGE